MRLNIQNVSFSNLGVGENVLKAVKLGFIEPTQFSSEATSVLLADETNFVGLAQTGTEKQLRLAFPFLDSPTYVFQLRAGSYLSTDTGTVKTDSKQSS
ncbi:MAG: hypothetical protein IPI10_14525 [Bacteroidetes bacterium]|nr:hypothetical protein [Bacteroidota bacterium]